LPPVCLSTRCTVSFLQPILAHELQAFRPPPRLAK
jgi:hypothetical protein